MDTKRLLPKSPPARGLAAVLLAGLFWLLETTLRAVFRRAGRAVRQGARSPAPTPTPRPPDVSARSLESGHEVSDVSVGKIFGFGFGLAVSVLLVLAVGLLFFRVLGRWDRRAQARQLRHEPGAISRVPAERSLAGPLLQVKPEEDLRSVRADYANELGTYGWLNRPAGVVRLPIERAMDLIAERGLPPVSPGKTAVQIQQERALPENRRDDQRQPTFAPSSP